MTRADSLRRLNGTEDALESIIEAIKKAGYKPGRKCEGGDVAIGLDCASSEFYKDGVYDYTKFEGAKGAKRTVDRAGRLPRGADR